MNVRIGRLFGVFVLLFAVLVGATSWATVFGASSLDKNSKNRRGLIRDARVPRGLIRADDGTVLARNRARGRGQNRFYSRVYPTGPLFAHSVGYSFIRFGRTGLESSRNDALTGRQDEFQSVLSQLESRGREGEDVYTNLDPAAQRAALQGLAGRAGAVVAMEPTTGKVRVMASVPGYDPNQIPDRFGAINRATGSPIVNRATQSRYPPGSTFKVVTATAALDSGKFTPDSTIDGSSPKVISGRPLFNDGGESFGQISLTDALTHSVNTVFAQVGLAVGKQTLLKYMDRFGFDRDPSLDYPGDEMTASGIRDAQGRLLTADAGFDLGRVAIGQGGAEGAMEVTPLQMAMVASAIADGGKLMRPRLTDRVVGKDGRVRERVQPKLESTVMSPKSAGELGQMMSKVVEEGTGTAAALQGIKVAGKTGTAEVANGTANQAWFIAFAPVDHPRMAIAVTVERTQGQGGTVAAPIAKQVLQVLLRGG